MTGIAARPPAPRRNSLLSRIFGAGGLCIPVQIQADPTPPAPISESLFYMHIFHWVPSSGAPPAWSCVKSWVNLQLPEGGRRTFKQSLAGSVRIVWNEVVREFLKTDAEWMFSTHHDVAFEPGTLLRLLSWDKPLVSALVFMRHNPVVPQIWQKYEDGSAYAMRINDTRKWFYEHKEWIKFGPFIMEPRPDDALAPVTFTATACTLIHRTVFEDIRAKIPNQNDGYWFVCDNELSGGGEDRRFYEYAAQVGYPAFVDRSCIAGHIAGDIPTSSADFIYWDSVSRFENTGEQEPHNHREAKAAATEALRA